MSLDISKLRAVHHAEGKTIAQCPACAAGGSDKSGNHLIVWPDGRYGCVANPGDADHRKEIWRIVGGDLPEKQSVVSLGAIPGGFKLTNYFKKQSDKTPEQICNRTKDNMHHSGTAGTGLVNSLLLSEKSNLVKGENNIPKHNKEYHTSVPSVPKKIDREDYLAHVEWSKRQSDV